MSKTHFSVCSQRGVVRSRSVQIVIISFLFLPQFSSTEAHSSRFCCREENVVVGSSLVSSSSFHHFRFS